MRRTRFDHVLLSALFVAALMLSAQTALGPMAAAADPPNARGVERATEVQERNTERLMSIQDVVGTATGLDQAGQAVVKVYTARAGVGGIPGRLEGVPVVVEVTGPFVALAGAPPGKKPPADDVIDRTDRFNSPVPIGVSVGNEWEWSAGTLGCRVIFHGDKDQNYAGAGCALSNLHVFDSDQNGVELAERIVQPARLDDPTDNPWRPYATENNILGTLVAYWPIFYDGEVPFGWENRIDAAIAVVPATWYSGSMPQRLLGIATPRDGYGAPKSGLGIPASLGMQVQKYGRTTGLTKGEVTGIGATVLVGYTEDTATFVDQIIVSGRGIIKAGDSGSLLVTDPGRQPVGLMFAGSQNARYGIANPIGAVCSLLNITIDGEK